MVDERVAKMFRDRAAELTAQAERIDISENNNEQSAADAEDAT